MVVEMRKKFIVLEKLNEARIENILSPILAGKKITTHKITYRTSKGIIEYVSVPQGQNRNRYGDNVVSDSLNKIIIWSNKDLTSLEDMLRSNEINLIEILKDGPLNLELKS
jgi:hypothetical protein